MGLIDETVSSLTVAKTTEATLQTAESAAMGAVGLATTAVMTAGVRSLEAASGMRFDPAPAYLFFVELSGIFVALFTKCSGLSVKRDTTPVQEGGVNNYVHKLPGRLEFGNITLERGLSLSTQIWDWMMQGQYDCRVKRINFSIIQGAPGYNLATAIAGATGLEADAFYTVAGQGFGKVKHWNVENAYPVSWKLSDLNTSSTNAAIETLEIAHHGLSLSHVDALTPMSLTAGASDLIPL